LAIDAYGPHDLQRNDYVLGNTATRSQLLADGPLQRSSASSPRTGTKERLQPAMHRMTVAEFLESKFLPERISTLRYAGRTHYMAMLKHILNPEEVSRVFHVDLEKAKTKLKAVPGWPYIGDVALQDARPEHIVRLTEAAFEKGYSARTISHIRNVVRAVFAHAGREHCFFGENPAGAVVLSQTQRMPACSLTFSQTKEVLGMMAYPEKEMTCLTICTDMGVAEICGLQWKFVNLTSQEVCIEGQRIPPQTIAIRKQWYRNLLSDVTIGRSRNLPMSEAMMQMVLAIKGKSKFTGPEDFVLTSRLGTPINQTNISTRHLQPLVKQLQLPALSWQLLRRSRKALVAEFGSRFQEMVNLLLTATFPQVSNDHHAWHCRIRRTSSDSKGY